MCNICGGKMSVLVVILSLVCVGVCSELPRASLNKTTPKDMYVVRATVYQLGILTQVKNDTTNMTSGKQEAITFYHTNGSNIDMSAIPRPLMTNVTAENVVGVGAVNKTAKQMLPWNDLKDFTLLPPGAVQPQANKISKRDVVQTSAKIEKGAALIPKETGVQSIALPPLLTLNNNLSKIPVPIPNVSVVSYAKVNTLVHTP